MFYVPFTKTLRVIEVALKKYFVFSEVSLKWINHESTSLLVKSTHSYNLVDLVK